MALPQLWRARAAAMGAPPAPAPPWLAQWAVARARVPAVPPLSPPPMAPAASRCRFHGPRARPVWPLPWEAGAAQETAVAPQAGADAPAVARPMRLVPRPAVRPATLQLWGVAVRRGAAASQSPKRPLYRSRAERRALQVPRRSRRHQRAPCRAREPLHLPARAAVEPVAAALVAVAAVVRAEKRRLRLARALLLAMAASLVATAVLCCCCQHLGVSQHVLVTVCGSMSPMRPRPAILAAVHHCRCVPDPNLRPASQTGAMAASLVMSRQVASHRAWFVHQAVLTMTLPTVSSEPQV